MCAAIPRSRPVTATRRRPVGRRRSLRSRARRSRRTTGNVIELRGDEALAVFTSARNAIRAAVELQLALVDEVERNPELPLRVGIGLDAGEAVAVEAGYRGAALERGRATVRSGRRGRNHRQPDGHTLGRNDRGRPPGRGRRGRAQGDRRAYPAGPRICRSATARSRWWSASTAPRLPGDQRLHPPNCHPSSTRPHHSRRRERVRRAGYVGGGDSPAVDRVGRSSSAAQQGSARPACWPSRP